jgi:hypothetical protein
MSIDEYAKTRPVRPPIVNRNTNPSAHRQAALYVIRVPYIVASHLKILIARILKKNACMIQDLLISI